MYMSLGIEMRISSDIGQKYIIFSYISKNTILVYYYIKNHIQTIMDG